MTLRIASSAALAALLFLPALPGCTVESDSAATATADGETVDSPAAADGEVVSVDIQGSSTVFPIARSVADALNEENPLYSVEVARVGSGPGIKSLIANEADIANASRKIKDTEMQQAEEAGLNITEVPVALDGIAVVVNKDNDWIDSITVADLKRIWAPDSEITKWSDLDPSYPDTDLLLYSPDNQSGTFEYFTEEIVGEKLSQTDRAEFAVDDNQIVTGVSGNKGGMGYFGYGYLANNSDKLKGLSISTTDSTDDAVTPTVATIESGEYKPLARPLFIYLNNDRVKANAAATAFVRKMVSDEGQTLIAEEDMVSLSPERLEETRQTVNEVLGAE